MPCFASPKVTVSGTNNFTPDEIVTKLFDMDTSNWIHFNTEQATAIILSDSAIENVLVEKHFPDRINIKVTEREAVAVTFVVENGRAYPVQIDKNGVLFISDHSVIKSDMPIISGLPIEYMSNGMRIPEKYRRLINDIYKIRELPKNYFATISEICVNSKDSGNYELEIIPSISKVKVLTDRELNEESLEKMMVVLDVCDKLNLEISEVDLRYGSISFRTK